MSLLSPVESHVARETLPLVQERSFNARLRCNHCDRERSQVIRMLDEPNDPATIQDFYESGAVKEIDPDCMYCGETGATILGISYVRQPGDNNGGSTE